MPKLFWRQKVGDRTVFFDDAPFMLAGKYVKDCQYGQRYKTWKEDACTSQKENTPKKIRLQDTRKIGCHAHVEVKHYIVFQSTLLRVQERLLSKYGI